MAESSAASGETDAVAGGPPRRERLAQRRKALGLTQEDLAALLRVERSTVTRWERGETEPLPWLRPRLARALRVSPDRLAELLDDTAPPGALPGEGGRRQATRHGPAVTPRQLPATVTDFTGRAAELAALTGILDNAGDSGPGTVVIAAIGGTAGVGKTTLALYWAHRVADRFPDGQLHLNLRGFDPSGSPVTAGEAIRGFLDALGVPRSRIPPGPDAQAALYRSLLADKRVLIVLDNARDEQQVRPLLPASPASLVIVTSRSQLTGLAAEHRVLVAAIGTASGVPCPHAWQLPHAMLHFLTRWGYLREWASLERIALDCATRLGDARGQAVSHHMLGNACGLHGAAGDLPLADQAWRDALAILENLGDPGAARIRARLAASPADANRG